MPRSFARFGGIDLGDEALILDFDLQRGGGGVTPTLRSTFAQIEAINPSWLYSLDIEVVDSAATRQALIEAIWGLRSSLPDTASTLEWWDDLADIAGSPDMTWVMRLDSIDPEQIEDGSDGRTASILHLKFSAGATPTWDAGVVPEASAIDGAPQATFGGVRLGDVAHHPNLVPFRNLAVASSYQDATFQVPRTSSPNWSGVASVASAIQETSRIRTLRRATEYRASLGNALATLRYFEDGDLGGTPTITITTARFDGFGARQSLSVSSGRIVPTTFQFAFAEDPAFV